MYIRGTFTKENFDYYFSELAKEFKKNGKKIHAEIIIVGGGAVVTNYGFRETTTDVDAIIQSEVSMREAINNVGDRLGLPNGWLNSDFKKTSSYTYRLIEYSKYYKTFGGVIDVRMISGKYLVAMKLKSGRLYKSDMSDIVGIIMEEKNIDMEDIKDACEKLYGGYDNIPESSRTFVESVFQKEDLQSFYLQCVQEEKRNKDNLINEGNKAGLKIREDNIEEIFNILSKR
ncbi:MAG: DUF6036 family nucleotidyltransferase [Clostridia bacterium]|nr:DUF6036 family nucleotidyltransferase [Clostridia bacterium]